MSLRRVDLDTHTTLFGRLRAAGSDAAWCEFEARYGEMLFRFCRSLGLQHADAEDAVQAVLTKLVTGLESFQYDRRLGRFRDYLFRCARSAICDLKDGQKRRAGAVFLQDGATLDAAAEHRAQAQFDREWVHHHYRLAIEQLRGLVDPRSFMIFEQALMNQPIRLIAEQMHMKEDAVYKAQQRVRERLRTQIEQQIREEDAVDG